MRTPRSAEGRAGVSAGLLEKRSAASSNWFAHFQSRGLFGVTSLHTRGFVASPEEQISEEIGRLRFCLPANPKLMALMAAVYE
jgi:hypothetical protein